VVPRGLLGEGGREGREAAGGTGEREVVVIVAALDDQTVAYAQHLVLAAVTTWSPAGTS
jgi:hypothetical protein